MRFPVEWAIGPWTVPAHLVFESLGYLAGSRLFFALRRRTADFVTAEQRWTLIAGAAVGALLGSKALVWIQHAGEWGVMASHPESFAAGKTIVVASREPSLAGLGAHRLALLDAGRITLETATPGRVRSLAGRIP